MYFSNCVERWRGYITHVMDYVTEPEEEKQKDPSIYSRSLSLKKQIIVNNNNF